jgi:inner membrane protein
MASAFSHVIASVAIGNIALAIAVPNSSERASIGSRKFWLLAAFCAVIPDADAIGYWMGVPYDSLWGHRGITHSVFFAVLLAAAVMYLFYRTEKPFSRSWWILYLIFFVATVSHGILDAFTTGGLGVAFFAPFWDERYFFPWKVIKVSPISVTRFFSEKGLRVLKSEFVWVWIPSFIVILISYFINKLRSK